MLGTRTRVWRVLTVTQAAGTSVNVEMDTKKLLPPKPVVSERAVICKDWVKYLYVWLIPWSYVWLLEIMLRLNHRLNKHQQQKPTWNRLSETCVGRPTVTQKPVFGLGLQDATPFFDVWNFKKKTHRLGTRPKGPWAERCEVWYRWTLHNPEVSAQPLL